MSIRTAKIKLAKAIANYPDMVVHITELATATGYSDEEMAYAGLSVMDLKQLNRAGIIELGYTRNATLGEDPKLGRFVQHGNGSRRRWLVVDSSPKQEVKNGEEKAV